MRATTRIYEPEDRSANGPFVFVGLLFAALMWGTRFDGPTYTLNPEYWRTADPFAAVAALLFAWCLRERLVGRRYKPRGQAERTVGPRESWGFALVVAALLTPLGMLTVANVANRLIGVPYVERYVVTGKYEFHGKHTCYGLHLSGLENRSDRFDLCVPPAAQDATAVGDELQVTGRRSRFVNQMLSFTNSR